MMMTIIWCKPVRNTKQLLTLAKQNDAQGEMDISQFLQLPLLEQELCLTLLQDNSISIPSFTGLLPKEVSITRSGFNNFIWASYTKKALQTIADMGGQFVCLDNWPSRFLQWDHEQSEAKQQLIRYVIHACQAAQEHGIQVLLEPLTQCYTHQLSSVEDVIEFIELVKMPNLGLSINDNIFQQHPALIQEPKLRRINVSEDRCTQELKTDLQGINEHEQLVICTTGE